MARKGRAKSANAFVPLCVIPHLMWDDREVKLSVSGFVTEVGNFYRDNKKAGTC